MEEWGQDDDELWGADDEVDETTAPVGRSDPYQYKPQIVANPMYNLTGAEPTKDVTPEEYKKAAASGVNIDGKLPAKESALASLASNPIEERAYIETYLAQRYDNPPVRTGPDSGELEFFNPETERWEFAKPNAGSALGEAIEFIPSTAGSIAGGMGGGSVGGVPGAVAGGAGGAGLGQAIGNFAKAKLGQLFGLNESIQDSTLATDAAVEGAKTTAIDLATVGTYGALRGMKAVIFGRQFLKPEEAQTLLRDQKRMDALIKEVEKTVPGAKFRPFTAAASDNAAGDKLMSAGAQVFDEPEVGQLLSRQVMDNEKVLAAYFDNTTLKYRMNLDAPHEGAVPLKNAIEAERQQMDALTAGKANAQDAARQQLDKLPTTGPAEAGGAVRQGLAEKHMQAQGIRRQAYATYQSEAKYSAETGKSAYEIPVPPELLAHQKSLADAVGRSPLKRLKASRKKGLLDLEDGEKQVPNPDLDAWLTTGKVPKAKEGPMTLNLADVDDTIKQLRKDIRSAKAGKLNVPYGEREASVLLDKLVKMRNDFLESNAPEARAALEKAEHAQFVEAETFRRGLAKTLLTKEGGEYKLTDARVISSILRNKDPSAAEGIAEILQSNPKAMHEAQNYLFALYRRSVATDADRAVPVYKNHQRFMENYGPVLDKFFRPDQQAKLRELGGFAKVIHENGTNLKILEQAWNRSFKGKVGSMSAEGLVDGVFTKGLKNEDVRQIHTIAARYSPEVLASWKAGVAEKMRERMFKDGLVNGTSLNRLMSDGDALGKIQTLFGPSYIRNLETLQKGLELARKTPPDVKLPGKHTFWTDLARATYAAPMSREGRVVSLFQNTRSTALANQIYKALSDPAELEKLASRTRRTMQTVIGLNTGATALQAENEYHE